MGFNADRVRVAARTTNGAQSFTVAGFGTPKLAIFHWSYAIADNTATDDLVEGRGATDGTTQGSRVFFSLHGGTSSVSGVNNNTARCIQLFNAAGTLLGYAVFNAWVTDGVEVTWTITTARAVLIEVELFGGTDLSAIVLNQVLTNTVDVATDITAVGFEADNVLTFTCSTNGVGVGFVHNDRAGTISQIATVHRTRSGRPTMEVVGITRDTYGGVFSQGAYAADGNSWLEFSAFDASGVTVTPRTAAPGTVAALMIFLRYGTTPVVASKVYIYTTPTATGNSTDTTPNFTPQFVIYYMTLHEALATHYDTSLAGSTGWSAITAAGQNSQSYSDEDAAADANTQCLDDDQAVNLPLHDGSAGMAATFVSFAATGPTLNWSDIEAAGKKWLGWAIEAEAAGGAMSGSSAGSSTVSGTLTGAGALAGASAGATTVNGVLAGAGALAGASAGLSTASGTVAGSGALSGLSEGIASVSGVLVGAGALSGASAGVATGTATLAGAGALSGLSEGTCTVSGTLSTPGAGDMSGVASGTATASGTLTGAGALAGLSAGTGSATATLAGVGALSGIAQGTVTVSGAMLGYGALIGSVACISDATGTLLGAGALSGLAAGTSTATLTYTAAVAPGRVTGSDAQVYEVVSTDTRVGAITASILQVGSVTTSDGDNG